MRARTPKYEPQFLVLSWTWTIGRRVEENIRKMIEENFPIEKLQAMIDK